MSSKRQPPKTARKLKTKKKNRRPGLFAWIVSLFSVLACGYFLIELIKIDILPTMMLLVLLLVIVLLMVICVMVWLLKTRKPAAKIIMGIVVAVLGLASAFGGFYLRSTDAMFASVTNLTSKQSNTVTTYVMSATGAQKPSDLHQARLGVVSSLDQAGTEGAIAQLKEQGADVQEYEYADPFSLVDALYAGDVDAIAFPEQFHDQIYEAANDINKYNALTTFTNTVDTYIYYVDRDPDTINRPDPVANIMTDPFVLLVSGNDSYGSIGGAARSDVNMLVCVNPRTAQVLIVSLPRDTYTEITCKKNRTACANVEGEPDKLTHSGIYGIAATESTIEDLLDITVNYYVRVNFSSLINIVDAIGGIDVEVEPGLEVDRFYANGTEGVHAGVNHLNGERALAFARERYAYVDGDNQRIKNQQIVLKAMIRAMMSPSMAVNYPSVMKALSTAFDTNLSEQEIKSLITLELARFPDWNIQSYAIPGVSATEYSVSVGDLTSVTLVSQSSIDTAREMITDVLHGRTIDLEAYDTSQTPEEIQQEISEDPAGIDPNALQGAPEDSYGQDPYSPDSYPSDPGVYDPYSQPAEQTDYCTLYPYDPACQ